MKKISGVIFCMMAVLTAIQAQNFTLKSKIDQIDSSGFYRIRIDADVAARSNVRLQDLRLFDNKGNEIPYLLKKEEVISQQPVFKTFPFTMAAEGNKVNIIVENGEKLTVNKLLFTLKNADATRLVRISGSDDKQQWYVVKDSFYFESLANTNTPLVKKALLFPESDYRFFKIEISNGKNESPLNIVNIGNDDVEEKKAQFQPINGFGYNMEDSNKTTVIRCKLKPGNRIDQLKFVVTEPETYMRHAYLECLTEIIYSDSYTGSSGMASKEKRTYIPRRIEFNLSSDTRNEVITANLLGINKQEAFSIYISNKDDIPLQIKDIKALQLVSTITAKLDKDKSYFLYFGDSLLPQPEYDLVYFAEKIPATVPTIGCGKILPKETQVADEYNGNKDKWIVWVGLGMAGLTILFLTLNMMKKMKAEA